MLALHTPTVATPAQHAIPEISFSAAIIEQNGSEIGTVNIFSDLRERLRMRKELEDTRMQLIQAEKIAPIGRLVAGIAHEINNLFSGILIFADKSRGQKGDLKVDACS